MIEKKITAIIIEDDEDAISLLEIYLQAFHEIEIIGKATSSRNGVKLLKRKIPDIVFLDIDMPELSGLEVARQIKEQRLKTEIIFTTAYNEYAYNALEVEPLDYLLKPFGPEEIIAVINHFKSKTKRNLFEHKMNLLMKSNNADLKVKLPTRTGIVLLVPEDVMLLRSETNYCRVYQKNGEIDLVTLNIYKVASLLNLKEIIKANRSAYINFQYLKKIEKKSKICYLSHNDITYEEQINKSSMAFFEELNCFTIV